MKKQRQNLSAMRVAAVSLLMGMLVAPGFPQSSNVSSQSSQRQNGNKSVANSAIFREDWNSITLQGSNLVPDRPVLGEKYDLPGNTFIRELYQVVWRPGDPIDLYVVLPKGVKKPPVILYLYSYPQDTERFKNDHWCGSTTANGYAAVGFVSALTGHRAEHRPPKEWFVSEFQESLATSTHDVQMILNYLASRGDLDMDRVAMLGQGSGGSIAILASAADSRIKALDLLTPWGDWPTWLAKSKFIPEDQRATYLTPEFLTRVATLDPLKLLPKVKAQSVRLQNVRKDGSVPDIVEERMETAAPEIAEINQFADGRALVPAAAGGKLLEWIKAQLGPDAKPPVPTTRKERVHFYTAKSQTIQ